MVHCTKNSFCLNYSSKLAAAAAAAAGGTAVTQTRAGGWRRGNLDRKLYKLRLQKSHIDTHTYTHTLAHGHTAIFDQTKLKSEHSIRQSESGQDAALGSFLKKSKERVRCSLNCLKTRLYRSRFLRRLRSELTRSLLILKNELSVT